MKNCLDLKTVKCQYNFDMNKQILKFTIRLLYWAVLITFSADFTSGLIGHMLSTFPDPIDGLEVRIVISAWYYYIRYQHKILLKIVLKTIID